MYGHLYCAALRFCCNVVVQLCGFAVMQLHIFVVTYLCGCVVAVLCDRKNMRLHNCTTTHSHNHANASSFLARTSILIHINMCNNSM